MSYTKQRIGQNDIKCCGRLTIVFDRKMIMNERTLDTIYSIYTYCNCCGKIYGGK